MVMSERSTVVGVFTDELYADLAADDLRRVGFSDEEITISRHKDEESGFKAGLKRLFKGQDTTPVATTNDFMRMGVPEKNAHYYQSELDAGHTVVLVRVVGQQQQATEILPKHGATTSRNRDSNTQAEADQPTMAPDMYDPIANREAGDSMVTSEDPR